MDENFIHWLMQVERERNLLNIKLLEFDNLRHKLQLVLQSPTSARPSFPPVITQHASSVTAQSHITPVTSSFSQPGASANIGPVTRQALLIFKRFLLILKFSSGFFNKWSSCMLLSFRKLCRMSNYLFWLFGFLLTVSTFDFRPLSPGNNNFGQASLFQVQNQTSSVFGMKFESSGFDLFHVPCVSFVLFVNTFISS